jgi:hypothetical protein
MNGAGTKMRIPKSLHLPLIVAGIVAISFSTLAMTHVPLRWMHRPPETPAPISAQDDLSEMPSAFPSRAPASPDQARVKTSCECGVVASVRRASLGDNAPAVYEITIRMRDGATRIVSVANHGNWRPRDRITLIGGEHRSVR